MLRIRYKDYMYYKENQILMRKNLLQEEKEEYILQEEEKTDKIHDKMFRQILNNKKEFTSFINNFFDLKKELKEEEIENFNKNYITKQYKEKISDIVYKIKDKNVYFIIEHQTKNDYKMLSRMFDYTGSIIEETTKTKNFKCRKEYPQIIPIVLYTGYESWKADTELLICNEYIEMPDIRIGYNLVNVDNYTKKFLLDKKAILTNAMLIEKSKNLEELVETLEKVIENLIEDQKEEMILIIDKVVKKYINNNEIVDKLLEKIKRKEVVGMTPLAHGILLERKILREEGKKEGMKEGLREGIINGMEKKKKEIVKNMIRANLKKDVILKLAEITEQEYENIRKEVISK